MQSRRGFLGTLANGMAAITSVGVFGLPEVEAGPVEKLVVKAKISEDKGILIPELWAKESLKILEQNMVMGNLVHRDYGKAYQAIGRVNNAR